MDKTSKPSPPFFMLSEKPLKKKSTLSFLPTLFKVFLCFCLLLQTTTCSTVHHSVGMSSSPTTTMGEPCFLPPTHAVPGIRRSPLFQLCKEMKENNSPQAPHHKGVYTYIFIFILILILIL